MTTGKIETTTTTATMTKGPLSGLFERMDFEKNTGYKVGTSYSLPRLPPDMEMTLEDMVFPYMVFTHQEAKDRFDKMPYMMVQTMTPDKKDHFGFYQNVFLRSVDYWKTQEIIVFIASTLKLRPGRRKLIKIKRYYLDEYRRQLEIEKQNYQKAIFAMRMIIEEEITIMLEAKPFEKKYKNLVLGMIRHAFGIHIGDCNHD